MIKCDFDKVEVHGIEPLILTELTILMRTVKDHIEAKHGKEYADDKIRSCIQRVFCYRRRIRRRGETDIKSGRRSRTAGRYSKNHYWSD